MQQQQLENRVQKIVRRYKLYLNEKNQVKKINKTMEKQCSHLFARVISLLKCCWNKIIPINIRGISTQYQQIEYLMHLYKKEVKLSSLISNLSIEDIFSNGENQYCLGLVYSQPNFQQVMNRFQQIHSQISNFLIYPIKLESKEYQQTFKPLIGQCSGSLILIYKGLFQQLHIVSQISLKSTGFKVKINSLFKEAASMSKNIKQMFNNCEQTSQSVSSKKIFVSALYD